jgi:hypothetical protein
MRHLRKILFCEGVGIRRRYSYNPETGVVLALESYGPNNNRVFAGDKCGYLHGGYLAVNFNLKRFYLHRLCWFLHYGYWPALTVDHINGVKDDNRIENLRELTQRQNCRSYQTVSNKSSSKYRGVSRVKDRWRAQINVPTRKRHIGYFGTQVDAAIAYNKEATKLGFSKEALNVV